MQTFKTGGEINAKLISINRGGRLIRDWEITDEKTACASCLICNHYKYNHDNIKLRAGKFVHICLSEAPTFIDLTVKMKTGLNTSCVESFSRRALG